MDGPTSEVRTRDGQIEPLLDRTPSDRDTPEGPDPPAAVGHFGGEINHASADRTADGIYDH